MCPRTVLHIEQDVSDDIFQLNKEGESIGQDGAIHTMICNLDVMWEGMKLLFTKYGSPANLILWQLCCPDAHTHALC